MEGKVFLSLPELEQTLLELMKPDTEVVAKATALLKKYFKNPECILNLVEHMTCHLDSNIRLLCSICLKKKLTLHWGAIDSEQKEKIKVLFLETYSKEENLKLKENIGGVIAKLAMILVPNKEFDLLFQFLNSKIQSAEIRDQREAVVLLSIIVESLGNLIEDYSDNFHTILKESLQSKDRVLKRAAIKTMTNLSAANIKLHTLLQFQDLLPLIVQQLEEGDEGILDDLFETFSDLIEIPKFLTPHVKLLVELANKVATFQKYDDSLRKKALYFIEASFKNKAKVLKKDLNLLDNILQSAFLIAGEKEEIGDDEELTPFDCSLDLFEELSISIPNKLIYTPLMKGCLAMLNNENAHFRRAGLLILGTVSKGITDPIKGDLNNILNKIVEYFNDTDVVVKENAGLCITYFVENVGLEVIKQHNIILPHLINLLKQASQNVLQNEKQSLKLGEKMLFAVDTFCESMLPNEINEYLNPLLETIIPFLDSTNTDLTRRALSALCGISIAAKEKIIPYFEVIMQKLNVFIFGGRNKDMVQKGKAIIAAGHIGLGVGKDLFQNYIQPIAAEAMKELTGWESFDLSEAAYSFFGDMANLLHNEFSSYLQDLVPLAFKSCLADDGIEKHFKEKEKFSLDSDSEDEEKVDNLQSITFKTTFIDEKASAIHALGIWALNAPLAFQPYMDKCLEVFEGLWGYFHENIRYQMLLTYQQFLESTIMTEHMSTENGKLPSPIPSFPPLQSLGQKSSSLYTHHVFPKLLDSILLEEDKEVVGKSLECLADLLRSVGSCLLGESHLDPLGKSIIKMLQRKSECQKQKDDEDPEAEDDEEEEEDKDEALMVKEETGREEGDSEEEEDEIEEEDIDHDELLLVNVLDLIAAIAEATGDSPDIYSFIISMLKETKKLLLPPHPQSDAVLAVGCIGDTLRFINSGIQVFYKELLPVCVQGCSSQEDDMSRNCAYTIGIFAMYGKKDLMIQELPQVLLALRTAFQNSEKLEAKDNAVSALAKLLVNYSSAIPLEQVFPAVFGNIPVNGDVEENPFLMTAILDFGETNFEQIAQYSKSIILTGIKIIVDEKCKGQEEEKKRIGLFFSQISSKPEILAILNELSTQMSMEEKTILQKYIIQP